MRTLIILNETYPNGFACSKRIHLYAKALIANKHEVLIILPKAKYLSIATNLPRKGNFEGINYLYGSRNPSRSSNFFTRGFGDIISPLRAFYQGLKYKPDSILFVSTGIYHLGLFKLLARMRSAKLIAEKSEVPFKELDTISKKQKRKVKRYFSHFDGIISISDALTNFWKHDIGLKSKYLTVPILKEFKDNINNPAIIRQDTLLYTGTLLERKDGILTLLEALVLIKKERENIKLVITGNAKQSRDYKMVKHSIKSLNLTANIEFTGFIDQSELDLLLQTSTIHVLAKPDNRQNKYNFPTKIGEYLESGRPVVCTASDSLRTYLVDKEHLYYCNLSAKDLASTILHVLTHIQEAEEVGNRGKVLASKCFNYKTYGENLSSFLN